MNNRFENWSDIRVFLAVLREGSTLAASRSLCMSQPTVARRIEALEHALGLTLFERDTRGFRPTSDARAIERAAEAMEAASLQLCGAAAKRGRGQARPIRLTAPPANFTENLTSLLTEFSADHPGTTFEFISSYTYIDLAGGEADVALRIAREITDERLICRRLTHVTASLYASEGYAEQHGMPESMDDLAGHKFVVMDGERQPMTINQLLLDRITPGQIVSRCSDVDSLMLAIKAGFGIGPIGTSMAADHPTLKRCFPAPPGTGTGLWLLVGPDAWRRDDVKAFVKFFAPRYAAKFKRFGPQNDPS